MTGGPPSSPRPGASTRSRFVSFTSGRRSPRAAAARERLERGEVLVGGWPAERLDGRRRRASRPAGRSAPSCRAEVAGRPATEPAFASARAAASGPTASWRSTVAGIDLRRLLRERRLADDPVPRPAADLGPDDELGLHPDSTGSPGQVGRSVVERVVGAGPGVERGAETGAGDGVDAAADAARVAQPAAIHDAHDQRAEVAVTSLAGHVPADDQLLGRADLELEPRRRAASGLVAAPAVLRHRPLETLRGGGREEGDAVALDVAPVADARVLAKDEAEDRLALLERHVEVRAPGAPGQVEGHEDERCARPASRAAGLAGRSDAEKPPPRRAWRRPKSGRPSASSATTSPSTTASGAASHVGGPSSSGKYRPASWPLRVRRATFPSATIASTR